MPLTAPAPLVPAHDCAAFDCGDTSLNEWLRKRAPKNEAAHGSRCFVVCDGTRVIGFYVLAAGSLSHEHAPGAIRRNMPDPIPAIVLGRLAVDRTWQNRGLGADLLHDAVLRTLRAAHEIGARVLLCHALNERALRFYLRHNFIATAFDPLIVMLDLKRAEALLSGQRSE